MAADDYLTPYETALAVVATAMKKLRLRIDQLMLNSFIGGLLFTTGGMLHVMAQSESPALLALDPGIVHLVQGTLYPIGLFYVAVLGMELFNANVLYFSAALCRGAVSVLDLAVSWLVSWWINLVGTIFVCYIICHYSAISLSEIFVKGLIDIMMAKVEFSFVQTMLKGAAGNFFVSLAIYLQLMCRPIHVRFFMIFLPIFSFVSMGFTHVVADMYMMVIGLINGAPCSVATVAWKILVPGTIGNILGGLFFGVVIAWYCHIYAVERDQAQLNLPKYDMRDEQPDVNVDSRVVRQRPSMEAEMDESSSAEDLEKPNNVDNIVRANTRLSRYMTNRSTRLMKLIRSPRNVFPVYGMGQPLQREHSISSGKGQENASFVGDEASAYSTGLCNWSEKDNESGDAPSAEFVGDRLRRALSRRPRHKDLENAPMSRRQSSASILPQRRATALQMETTGSTSSFPVPVRHTQSAKEIGTGTRGGFNTEGGFNTPTYTDEPTTMNGANIASHADSNDIGPTEREPSTMAGSDVVDTGLSRLSEAHSSLTNTPNDSSLEVKAYQPEKDLGEKE